MWWLLVGTVAAMELPAGPPEVHVAVEADRLVVRVSRGFDNGLSTAIDAAILLHVPPQTELIGTEVRVDGAPREPGSVLRQGARVVLPLPDIPPRCTVEVQVQWALGEATWLAHGSSLDQLQRPRLVIGDADRALKEPGEGDPLLNPARSATLAKEFMVPVAESSSSLPVTIPTPTAD